MDQNEIGLIKGIDICERVEFDSDPNKNPDLVNQMWFQGRGRLFNVNKYD